MASYFHEDLPDELSEVVLFMFSSLNVQTQTIPNRKRTDC